MANVLRCIHWVYSCMVLTGVGLLFYLTLLTSPWYVDSTVDSFSGGAASSDRLMSDLSGGEKSENSTTALLRSKPGVATMPNVTLHMHNSVLKNKKEIRGLLGDGTNVVWMRDIYESGFTYPNPQVCPNDGQDIRIIILILSAPFHFSSRDAIRLTWGHYAQRLDVSIAFLLGKTENETILDGMENEKRIYDDLIVSNFVDSYDNLTLKTMAILDWVDTYCNQSNYVLKVDDDMFINVPNLLKLIDRIEPEDKQRPKIYGRLTHKWKPNRDNRSKYFVSQQMYKGTVWPDFTTGPAYLLSTRLVRPLFEKSMEKTFLRVEDVYYTGVLAEELGIKRINISGFANIKVNIRKTEFCALSKLISMHMVAFQEQFELWRNILDGRKICEIGTPTSKLTSPKRVPVYYTVRRIKNSRSRNIVKIVNGSHQINSSLWAEGGINKTLWSIN